MMLKPLTAACCLALATTAQAAPWTMVASVYNDGAFVATGARFDPKKMAVAHKTLPFGTRLLLSYGRNIAEVRVNDRGPFRRGRDLDLTPAVQKALHFPWGVGRVQVQWFPPIPRPRPEKTP